MGRSLRPVCRLLCLIAIVSCAANGFAQSAGQNVNMVSGTDWTTGDPFLQRQNEPSLAVSTRNAAHLVGAANDYRSVDLPGLLGIEERGDAWMGIFKSFDAGQTWRSTLLPGYPFDSSPQGLASPLRSFQAAADPIVRAGTNGMFYVGGIVFNRGTSAPSAVFITRYIDNNNRENGDPTAKAGAITNVAPTDAIRYLGSKIVANGTSTTFVDKPWLAVDVPRGTTTCNIPFTNPDGTTGTEIIPASNVYMTYTTLSGSTSKINFIRSTDCGATWSAPVVLSQSGTLNQGTVIAVSPVANTSTSSSSLTTLSSSSSTTYSTGSTIYVAWRRFASGSYSDAIMLARSDNGGGTWKYYASTAVSFPKTCATTPTNSGCLFDQGLSTPNPYGGSFRTNAYPAMTVDDTGRVYLAWAQRQSNGDARVMMSVSSNGDYWSTPAAAIDNSGVEDDFGNQFVNLSGRGHQLMPTLNFNTGKLMLAYYDLRQDHTIGIFTPNADFSNFTETRELINELTDPTLFTSVFNPYVTDGPLAGFPSLTTRRHTVDLEGAQASPPTSGLLVIPTFNTFRISRYLFGLNPFDSLSQSEQLQVNTPNLPIFVQGTQPFMGDYIDVVGAPQFVLKNGKWQFNSAPVTSPIFHAVWTDNRDVRPPLDGNWQNYSPPFSASNPSTPHPSVFDPTQTVGTCSDDNHAGMRNQNIYTARVANGLVVTSPGNSKFLGFLPSNASLLFQRAYAINVQNATDTTRQFQFNILAQPPDAPTGQASMLQFSFSTTLGPITVAPHSSMSRPVFVKSSVATASIPVQVAEVDPANPSQLLAGGLQSTITINPDPTTPTIIDPANPSIANPSIANFEVYNPSIANPSIANPATGNAAIGNPSIANPSIANPSIANPAIVAALNPSIANPSIANPSIANPSIANPSIANNTIGNPSIANQPMTDASYTVSNVGNTSSSYAVKLFGNQPPNVNLQLIVTKTYTTPVQDNCQLGQQTTTFLVTNVLNPTFATTADIGDPLLQNGSISNSTLSLAPGETAQVTIRAFGTDPSVQFDPDQMRSLILGNVTPVIVAHPANTQDAVNGVATSPQTLVITTAGKLPDALVGQNYSALIATLGGVGNKTFTIISDPSLPNPLTLDPVTGAISGIPATGGAFTFTVQVSDATSSALRTFTLHIVEPLAIGTTTLPDGVVGTPYPPTTLAFTGGSGSVTWTVNPPTALSALGLTLNPATGAISGTPTTATSATTFTVTATDNGTPPQTASAPLTIRIATPLLATTNNNGRLPDAILNTPYSQSLTNTVNVSGGIVPYTYGVTTGTLPTGLTLSSTGLLSGTPTGNAATQPFTVTVADGSNPPQGANVPLSINVVAGLSVLTNSLPDGAVSIPYTTTSLVVGGGTGPFTWSITTGTLPAGLTFTNGVISGTPTAPTPGVNLTFSVTDSGVPAQTAARTLTLRVGALLTVATGTLPNAQPGVPYSQTLSATGGLGTLTWSVATGTLPAGLTLSPTGVISGTPTATSSSTSSSTSSGSTSTFVVMVVDTSSPQQSATRSLSLTVAAKYKISFYVQPSYTSPKAQITPAVKVLVTDANGVPVYGAVVNMTLSINPTGAVLTGTTATTGSNGIAIFAYQTVSKSGTAFQMQATAPGLAGAPSAVSNLFNVR